MYLNTSVRSVSVTADQTPDLRHQTPDLDVQGQVKGCFWTVVKGFLRESFDHLFVFPIHLLGQVNVLIDSFFGCPISVFMSCKSPSNHP